MTFDYKQPTAMFLGRYQPPHIGHLALIREGLTRVGQACICIRDTQGTDEKNPFDFQFIVSKFRELFTAEENEKIEIIHLPNITNIFYGRDVGYQIEKIELSPELQAVSATNVRNEMKAKGEL